MSHGLYDIPLYNKKIMGNDPKAWINKRMEQERRIEERPIGNKLLSFRIYDIMRNTLGFADPKFIKEEYSKEERKKLYPDGKKLAESFSRRLTLGEKGRKHQEEIIGTVRSRQFSEYEFLARKKITKSLIKLTKKLTARMRIVLLIDHEETRVKEKLYFKDRLEAKKALIIQDMLNRLPDEREYTKAAVMKERLNILGKTNELLEEELLEVRKLKENYLNKAYEFQVNWQLKNVGDHYQKKINEYSLCWSEMFTKMKILNMLEMTNPNSEGSQTLLQVRTIENVIEYLSNCWKESIYKTRNEFNEELDKVKKEFESFEKSISIEKMKKANLLEIINLSNSCVQNIVEQYEKMVVYGFKGTPGLCNFFLSYRMLEQLHQKFVEKALEKKKAKELSSIIPGKVSSEKLDTETEEVEELFDDSSSYEVDIFKSCKDIEKINLFRTNVLKVKNLIEEIKCAILKEPLQVRERMADISVELKTMSESHLKASNSRFIVNKLTDAYHLLENSLRKSPTSLKIGGLIEEKHDLVLERVEDIVKCFRRHPLLLTSFASV